jgi:hypothetical protein
MAGRKSPGTDPLGHSPMSKVKLEGPKVRHDDHGKDASFPSHKHIPGEHWELRYNATGPSQNMIDTEGADFNPKCAKDRKTTHIKVNETDH